MPPLHQYVLVTDREGNVLLREDGCTAQSLASYRGSFADWLRAALLVHPDGGVLRQLSGNRELLFVQTESVMNIKVCDEAVRLLSLIHI